MSTWIESILQYWNPDVILQETKKKEEEIKFNPIVLQQIQELKEVHSIALAIPLNPKTDGEFYLYIDKIDFQSSGNNSIYVLMNEKGVFSPSQLPSPLKGDLLYCDLFGREKYRIPVEIVKSTSNEKSLYLLPRRSNDDDL